MCRLITKTFAYSSRAAYIWKTRIEIPFTSNDVLALMRTEKLHHYQYNGNGSGCLTWTIKLVSVLEDNGVLAAGSTDDFLEVVKKARKQKLYWVPEEPGAMFFE
jgi:hypothetical protein